MAAMRGAERGRTGHGGGFHAGYGGGNYHYVSAPKPKPEPPKWTKLQLGCERKINLGLCELTLFQAACVAKHGEIQGITPADVCQKIFTGEMKAEPRHMYCRAAALDSALLTKAKSKELLDLVPEDPQECHVDHLVERGNGSWRISDHLSVDHFLNTKRIRSEYKGFGMRPFCRDLIKAKPQELKAGFCRSERRVGQDCEFFYGIRAGWSRDYGKSHCESFAPQAGSFRCLALRKQIIRIAQAKSTFNTVRFSSFDDAVRIDRKTCPEPPKDLPDEPNEEDAEVLELDPDQ